MMTNETDRELLELAAKACGYKHLRYCETHMAMVPEAEGEDVLPFSVWNPLTDDGDALRLAVKLKLDIHFFNGYAEVHAGGDGIKSASIELYGDDMAALTRRAIVRAAAEIGKAMP